MRYKKLLLPGALLSAATILGFNVSATRSPSSSSGVMTSTAAELAVRPTRAESQAAPDEYLRRGRLGPRLRPALEVMGDRLEKPGKERLVMTGMLTRAADSSPTGFTLVREFPDRLRLETQDGGQRHVSIYHGRAAGQGSRSSREADDIETLFFDTAERLFTAHAGGAAMRHLGDNFRLDGDASALDTSYSLYEITEDVNTGGAHPRQRTKIYALNSVTLLLERVRYETARDGETVRVEVRLGNWERRQGQMLPLRVERRENDAVIFSLDITSATVGPGLEDGTFTATTSRN
ncbi:MAG: hypothetical protein LC803_21925 [Acidobacteria bacterium]|nr:hypothetical protein [Acidobacteriota bacterium]